MAKKNRYQISTRQVLAAIQKLRLERGDVLLVSNYETLKYLSEIPIHLDFVVPLVFAPQGLKKLSRQDLLNLLEQLDQQAVPSVPPFESAAVPL